MDRGSLLQAAQKLVDGKRFEEAIASYRRLVEEDPRDCRALLKLADLYYQLDRRAEAAEAYAGSGQLFMEQDAPAKAVTVLQRAQKIVDDNPQLAERLNEVHVRLGEACAKLGYTNDAIAAYLKAASQLQKSGKGDESFELLLRASKVDPNHPVPHLRLAEASVRTGNIDAAFAHCGRAAEMLLRVGRRDDALKVVERLLQHRSDHRFSLLAAEILLDRAGPSDAAAALSRLQACLKAAPKDLRTLELLARAFDGLGQAKKAIEVQKEAARVARSAGSSDAFGRIVDALALRAPDDAEVKALVAQRRPAGRSSDAELLEAVEELGDDDVVIADDEGDRTSAELNPAPRPAAPKKPLVSPRATMPGIAAPRAPGASPGIPGLSRVNGAAPPPPPGPKRPPAKTLPLIPGPPPPPPVPTLEPRGRRPSAAPAASATVGPNVQALDPAAENARTVEVPMAELPIAESAASDPGRSPDSAILERVDFLAGQGLYEEAYGFLRGEIERLPGHPDLVERRRLLDERLGGRPRSVSPPAPVESVEPVELRAEVFSEAEALAPAEAASGESSPEPVEPVEAHASVEPLAPVEPVEPHEPVEPVEAHAPVEPLAPVEPPAADDPEEIALREALERALAEQAARGESDAPRRGDDEVVESAFAEYGGQFEVDEAEAELAFLTVAADAWAGDWLVPVDVDPDFEPEASAVAIVTYEPLTEGGPEGEGEFGEAHSIADDPTIQSDETFEALEAAALSTLRRGDEGGGPAELAPEASPSEALAAPEAANAAELAPEPALPLPEPLAGSVAPDALAADPDADLDSPTPEPGGEEVARVEAAIRETSVAEPLPAPDDLPFETEPSLHGRPPGARHGGFDIEDPSTLAYTEDTFDTLEAEALRASASELPAEAPRRSVPPPLPPAASVPPAHSSSELRALDALVESATEPGVSHPTPARLGSMLEPPPSSAHEKPTRLGSMPSAGSEEDEGPSSRRAPPRQELQASAERASARGPKGEVTGRRRSTGSASGAPPSEGASVRTKGRRTTKGERKRGTSTTVSAVVATPAVLPRISDAGEEESSAERLGGAGRAPIGKAPRVLGPVSVRDALVEDRRRAARAAVEQAERAELMQAPVVQQSEFQELVEVDEEEEWGPPWLRSVGMAVAGATAGAALCWALLSSQQPAGSEVVDEVQPSATPDVSAAPAPSVTPAATTQPARSAQPAAPPKPASPPQPASRPTPRPAPAPAAREQAPVYRPPAPVGVPRPLSRIESPKPAPKPAPKPKPAKPSKSPDSDPTEGVNSPGF